MASDLFIHVIEVFFFKAEDGIRDSSVTGVQRCALPISTPAPTSISRRARSARPAPRARSERARREIDVGAGVAALQAQLRSEERRGGKEGKTRGTPDHLKKKEQYELKSLTVS